MSGLPLSVLLNGLAAACLVLAVLARCGRARAQARSHAERAEFFNDLTIAAIVAACVHAAGAAAWSGRPGRPPAPDRPPAAEAPADPNPEGGPRPS